MSASVRIEDEAFSDERYEDLAQVAGLADADHARGKMAKIWRQCTLEQTHVLPIGLITRILGPQGVLALETARLGEKVGEDKVRIRGTKGRIEWLKRLRENGKFGKRGAEFGKRGGRPRKNPLQGVTENPPPAPAPAPVLTLVTSESAEPPRKTKKRVGARTLIPDDWQPKQSHREKAADLHLDCDAEADSFTSHHRSKGNTFVDHDAAFHTWLGNALRFGRQQTFGQSQPAPRRVVKEIE